MSRHDVCYTRRIFNVHRFILSFAMNPTLLLVVGMAVG